MHASITFTWDCPQLCSTLYLIPTQFVVTVSLDFKNLTLAPVHIRYFILCWIIINISKIRVTNTQTVNEQHWTDCGVRLGWRQTVKHKTHKSKALYCSQYLIIIYWYLTDIVARDHIHAACTKTLALLLYAWLTNQTVPIIWQ